MRIAIPGFDIQATVAIVPHSQAQNTQECGGNLSQSKVENPMHLLTSPKSIGPYDIEHPDVAIYLQLAVVIMYTMMVLIAALLGPKTLFITLWKMAVVLLGYTSALHCLDYDKEKPNDVLLAPIFFVGFMARVKVVQVTDKVFVKILKEIVEVRQLPMMNRKAD